MTTPLSDAEPPFKRNMTPEEYEAFAQGEIARFERNNPSDEAHRVAELEREVERLRAALRKFARPGAWCAYHTVYNDRLPESCRLPSCQELRAALAPQDGVQLTEVDRAGVEFTP